MICLILDIDETPGPFRLSGAHPRVEHHSYHRWRPCKIIPCSSNIMDTTIKPPPGAQKTLNVTQLVEYITEGL